MSDRPQGSVRTGTRDETAKAAARTDAAPSEAGEKPDASSVSLNQSLPTGQNRVVKGGR